MTKNFEAFVLAKILNKFMASEPKADERCLTIFIGFGLFF